MDSFSSDESLVYEGVRFSSDVAYIPDYKYEFSDSDTSLSSEDSFSSLDSGISDTGVPREESGVPHHPHDESTIYENEFFTICLECGFIMREFEIDMGVGAEAARLVNRLKNTNLGKFHQMCKMHLSFLLDLPGTGLQDFIGDQAPEQTPERPRSIFNFGKRKVSKENKHPESGCVFGAPLNQDILDAMFPILEFLEKQENASQEGLFRKSGHIGRQKILREKLNAKEDIQLELDKGVYSAHDCAGVLKTFLGELPEPLLTEKHYSAHCQVPEMVLDDKQIQTTQLLVQLLPADNATLLQCLLHLLHLVSRQDSSKMTADTLGTLFAPHLLVPKKMTASELQSRATNITRAVSFMIDRAPLLFSVPERLVRDIAKYWEEMEEGGDSRPDTDTDSDSITCRHRYRRRIDPSDLLINTRVSFADRQASQEASEQTDTQMALAQLYAHVSAMPESSKKRKLLKKFNKQNGGVCSPMRTPVVEVKPKGNGHKRTRSLGESLKKMVGRNHKRRGSGHSIQVHNIGPEVKGPSHMPSPHVPHTPVIRPPVAGRVATPVAATPVMRLFKHGLSQHQSILPSSPRVHIVDLHDSVSPGSGKRKAPGADSPAASPCGSMASYDDAMTHSVEEQENYNCNSPVLPVVKECGPVGRFRKHARAMASASPDRKLESAFISPITRSVNKAPKSIKTSMMTPGSRVPMAMIQTP